MIFLKYLKNRRIIGGGACTQAETVPGKGRTAKQTLKGREEKGAGKAEKPEAVKKAPRRRREDFPAEFDEVRGYELRQKLRPARKPEKRSTVGKTAKAPGKDSRDGAAAKGRRNPYLLPQREQQPACLNPVADYLPVSKVANGIIYTKDHRYVKVVEVVPVNFLLRSAREQRNIIYSFVSYLKVSPVRLQF